MSSIGGVTCSLIHGRIPGQKLRSVTWTVPAVNGVGVQQMGTGDAPFTIQAVLFSNSAGITTWVALIEALQGTVVSIIDDLVVTHTRCLIAKVYPVQVTSAHLAGGVSSAKRGAIRIDGEIV